MSEPARREATYDDLLEVPDTQVAEIIDGDLYVSPRPSGPHTIAASTLGMDLGGSFQRGRGGPGGWWIVFEPELHLGDHVLVPDLAGWRRSRMPEYPASAFVELPPDWICEVLSDSTRGLDLVRKLPIYGAFGVEWAWLVDPIAHVLEIMRLRDGQWVRHAAFEGGGDVLAEPFDAVPLELGALWDRGQSPPSSASSSSSIL